MAKKEETPGAKAERERLERQAESDRSLAREREADRKAAARRWWPSSNKPESAALREQRRQRDARRYEDQQQRREQERLERAQQPQQLGRNESAVAEYLRRHPGATPKEIAFHAIYGGGTVAWEGLHRKTRSNASAETSRVLRRLESKGAVKLTGYTIGGKPKYEVVHEIVQQDARGGGSWLTRRPEDMRKKDKGGDQGQPQDGAADKPTIGELLGFGGSDQGDSEQGTSLSELLGLPSRDPDPPDDDGPKGDGTHWRDYL